MYELRRELRTCLLMLNILNVECGNTHESVFCHESMWFTRSRDPTHHRSVFPPIKRNNWDGTSGIAEISLASYLSESPSEDVHNSRSLEIFCIPKVFLANQFDSVWPPNLDGTVQNADLMLAKSFSHRASSFRYPAVQTSFVTIHNQRYQTHISLTIPNKGTRYVHAY